MQHWKLYEIDTPDGSRSPVVLHSEEGESRMVLIVLDPGQELGEHQVKEAAFLLVVAGSARVVAGDESVDANAGDLFRFEPGERRSVSSDGGARLLLFLSPWPGVGHYRGEERKVSAS
jgi:quercetin dioxygenase-like cupin family protein